MRPRLFDIRDLKRILCLELGVCAFPALFLAIRLQKILASRGITLRARASYVWQACGWAAIGTARDLLGLTSLNVRCRWRGPESSARNGRTGALGRIHESGSSAARRNFGRIDEEHLEGTMREELRPWIKPVPSSSVCRLTQKRSRMP